jgi:hypothetical protein
VIWILPNVYRGSDEGSERECWHLLILPIIPPPALIPFPLGPRLPRSVFRQSNRTIVQRAKLCPGDTE